MTEENNFDRARERMVKHQLRGRDIKDARVLDAMGTVPRHLFVPPDKRRLAYADGPLPIGERQTISQPYIVALMTQLLELKGGETVLEVGTGSGYQASVLACLSKWVYTVERIPMLAKRAQETLKQLGVDNVEVLIRDGSRGLPEHAPFGAIIVTAGAPKVPESLKSQLADGAHLVVPVGGQGGQILERWTRRGKDFDSDHIAPVAFVPLVGDEGWESDERSSSLIF